MSENIKRIIVSVVFIPVIIAASYFGGIYFLCFVMLVSVFSFFEYYRLCKKKQANVNLFLGVIIIIFLILNRYENYIDIFTLLLVASVLLMIAELYRNKDSAILNLGATFLGIIYTGLFAVSLIALREFYPKIDDLYLRGGYLIISIFASIWIGDSAAYYGGTTFGKHRLFPRVSPKKSMEGAIFGFVFSVTAMILAKSTIISFLNWKNVLVIGIIIGTIGQLGDLVESLFKRDAGTKDSSGLIPGHGGMLDRFDSLLFSVPVIWIYLRYFD